MIPKRILPFFQTTREREKDGSVYTQKAVFPAAVGIALGWIFWQR